MLVKDVLGECLVKMGRENFLTGTEYTDEQQALADRLLAAMNIAYREAVTEYIPLYAEEKVIVADGTVDVGGLGKRILYPVSLTADGVRYRVWVRPEGLSADYCGRATLRYAYLPDEAGLTDEIADMRITPSALSDGTLAEYYLQDKVFDLAEAYSESFRDALSAVRYKGRAMRLGASGRRRT